MDLVCCLCYRRKPDFMLLSTEGDDMYEWGTYAYYEGEAGEIDNLAYDLSILVIPVGLYRVSPANLPYPKQNLTVKHGPVKNQSENYPDRSNYPVKYLAKTAHQVPHNLPNHYQYGNAGSSKELSISGRQQGNKVNTQYNRNLQCPTKNINNNYENGIINMRRDPLATTGYNHGHKQQSLWNHGLSYTHPSNSTYHFTKAKNAKHDQLSQPPEPDDEEVILNIQQSSTKKIQRKSFVLSFDEPFDLSPTKLKVLPPTSREVIVSPVLQRNSESTSTNNNFNCIQYQRHPERIYENLASYNQGLNKDASTHRHSPESLSTRRKFSGPALKIVPHERVGSHYQGPRNVKYPNKHNRYSWINDSKDNKDNTKVQITHTTTTTHTTRSDHNTDNCAVEEVCPAINPKAECTCIQEGAYNIPTNSYVPYGRDNCIPGDTHESSHRRAANNSDTNMPRSFYEEYTKPKYSASNTSMPKDPYAVYTGLKHSANEISKSPHAASTGPWESATDIPKSPYAASTGPWESAPDIPKSPYSAYIGPKPSTKPVYRNINTEYKAIHYDSPDIFKPSQTVTSTAYRSTANPYQMGNSATHNNYDPTTYHSVDYRWLAAKPQLSKNLQPSPSYTVAPLLLPKTPISKSSYWPSSNLVPSERQYSSHPFESGTPNYGIYEGFSLNGMRSMTVSTATGYRSIHTPISRRDIPPDEF